MQPLASRDQARHRIVVDGEIDLTTAPFLDVRLARVSSDVDVDCSSITFIDVIGFASLSRGYWWAAGQGYQFDVFGLTDFAVRVGTMLRVPFLRPSGAAA